MNEWDIELPQEIKVSRLIARIVRESEFGFRATDPVTRYRLLWKEGDRFLEDHETLLMAGVADHDTLVMNSDIVVTPTTTDTNSIVNEKIFIVHGHDEAMREAVARFLERIGFEVIIFHEQVNKGKTIIEKFENYSDVKFAVVLLSPDDNGSKIGEGLNPTARQNVLLEWGYFMGRLGRNRVYALKKGTVELPSDILGIVWESFDEMASWKRGLAQELEEAGYAIDWRKAMRP